MLPFSGLGSINFGTGLSVDNESVSYGHQYSCAQLGVIGLSFPVSYAQVIWNMINLYQSLLCQLTYYIRGSNERAGGAPQDPPTFL